jgi:hypothetical protein
MKTIWQIVLDPANPTNPTKGSLHWTCQTPLTEGGAKPTRDQNKCLNEDLPGSPHSKNAARLKALASWMDSYSPLGEGTCGDGQINLWTEKPVIPVDCLYRIKMNGQDAETLRRGAGTPQLASKFCSKSCTLLLVGIHIMMFVAPPSQPEVKPHWLWATFWWTPDSNCGEVKGPFHFLGKWAHFQMKATSSDITSDPKTVVYNPYLEGSADANGAVSNCVQCHKFASFYIDPGTKMLSTSRTGVVVNSSGPSLGLPPWPQAGPCPWIATNKTYQETNYDCGYLDANTITTQMIWSLNTRLGQLP